jgi:hypothetical protein
MEITTVVQGAWNAFIIKIVAFLPMLIGALIIFVIGIIIAKLLKMAIIRLLKIIRFDSATEKTGIKGLLQKGNIIIAPSEIIGSLIYWFIAIFVLIASLDALGLPVVSDILNNIFLYIPNVVAAIIVLILGLLFANLLSSIVQTASSNAGLKTSEALGKASYYAVIFFSISIALTQLGIGKEVVTAAFIIAFGAVALALAISFGLGGKEIAGEYLKRWLEGKKD